MSTNISCIVVDDEPLARQLLVNHIAKIPSLTLIDALASPLEAMSVLREKKPDILFLDVQMPEITGISLLKILENKPYVILTTAYSEYAIEGYELDVSDYLLKPITFERFLKAVEKAIHKIRQEKTPVENPSAPVFAPEPDDQSDSNFIFVKDGTRHIRVNYKDIMFIEGLKDYVAIHTPNQKITTLQNLKKLEQILPPSDFMRVHNSYIVSIHWIDEVERDSIIIGKKFIPISDSYRKAFREMMDKRQL